MTTIEELDAIRRSILTQPDDDTHRLVYADRLDERGEAGDAEHAEFIRVQVKLAALGREAAELLNDEVDWRSCTSGSAAWCPNCGDCCCPRDSLGDYPRRDFHLCPLHSPSSPHDCHEKLQLRIEELRDRETEMLVEWVPLMRSICPGWSWGRSGDNQFDAHHSPSARIYFSAELSRGFIGAITCTTEHWFDHASSLVDIERPYKLWAQPIRKVNLTTPLNGYWEGHGVIYLRFVSDSDLIVEEHHVHNHRVSQGDPCATPHTAKHILETVWKGITFTLPPEPV